MKKVLIILTALLLLAVPSLAHWDGTSEQVPACADNSSNCVTLQMVSMGCFAEFLPSDNLSQRVLSAALPSLTAVTEEDFHHFAEEFGMEASELQPHWYVAIGNCLWADILSAKAEDSESEAIRRVLHLFLDPTTEEDAHEQIEQIRAEIDDDLIRRMAETTGTTEDFIRHLIFSADWKNTEIPTDSETEKRRQN